MFIQQSGSTSLSSARTAGDLPAVDYLTGWQFSCFYTRLVEMLLSGPSDEVGTGTGVANTEPNMPLEQFLGLLAKKTGVQRQCFIASILLIRRFHTLNPRQPLTHLNIYRIALISLIVAVALLEDCVYDLESWDKLTFSHYGVSFLATLEQQYLTLIQWNVLITASEYRAFLESSDVVEAYRSSFVDQVPASPCVLAITSGLHQGTLCLESEAQ
ncbi:Cyclin family protein [Giardia muris]|uniref:Cyclin family protein n=1 Tax=Giardia muris TaxID=5742 RepID=A0A4Z1SMB8_GIAMU|nr:Cyclin family protein [Giardia muris]|eukprot:TNJ26826.1 Cyclin family protein [Giardia muris]